jgi:hypothetical protein
MENRTQRRVALDRAEELLDEVDKTLHQAFKPWEHFLGMGLLLALLMIFGAICFYLGRISVEIPATRLTGIHRLA